ncbi:MAG: bis(5'-nucleosyl)-tetraphosphatase (symmetrical) YqeK [Oscillospiraceae bacterium]|nr:bis(5'-nucleosyl)-tetraphosphatase (symmetrical) YqeK [Oscillospiraceae bacterium]
MKEENREYYRGLVTSALSKERAYHSFCVAKEAVRLADKYKADIAAAEIAGLLHDIMKESPPDTQLDLIKKYGNPTEYDLKIPAVWHSFAGAVYARQVLKIDNDDIINAIRYHTTARQGMSLLESIIYLADFISEDRDYGDADTVNIRRLADVGIDEAMRYSLSYSIRRLVDRERIIHPDTVGAYNEYFGL